MRFTLGDVHVEVAGEFAWVTCTENILSEVHGRVSVTAVLSTNLFERAAERWRMVHHHASPALASLTEAAAWPPLPNPAQAPADNSRAILDKRPPLADVLPDVA